MHETEELRRCVQCDSLFEATWPRQKRCRRRCRSGEVRAVRKAKETAPPKVRECAVPGCETRWVVVYGNQSRKYCGDACAHRAKIHREHVYRARQRGEDPLVYGICACCLDADRVGKRYCSDCAYGMEQERRRRRPAGNKKARSYKIKAVEEEQAALRKMAAEWSKLEGTPNAKEKLEAA